MSAPAEFRSVVGALQTNVPGIEIGGAFPEMARVADKMAFVRSFAHRDSGHGGGTHWVMTGYDFPPADNGQAPINPGFGFILARHRGATSPTTGLPTYQQLGVREYFLFDPLHEYLPQPLIGYRLIGNEYEPLIPADDASRGRCLRKSFVPGPTLSKDLRKDLPPEADPAEARPCGVRAFFHEGTRVVWPRGRML
jgi:hypothetical protein